MANIDELISLIRDCRYDAAMEMLNAAPELATARSEQEGQMHGETALHRAAHRNAVDLCTRLIELGADVNDADTNWWLTPLAWAADAASAEAVELLLTHGADVNGDAVVGTTALHAAAMGGSSQGKERSEEYRRTVEILINAGADVNRRSAGSHPQTPLDSALESEHTLVIELLRKHGAVESDSAE